MVEIPVHMVEFPIHMVEIPCVGEWERKCPEQGAPTLMKDLEVAHITSAQIQLAQI